jgi:uncharacterized protein YndB with AHSA1/START domain
MTPAHPTDDLELCLTRLIDAPRDQVWRCWTEPELLMQWFCPRPWSVAQAELDVRPGGRMLVVMQGPDGQQMPSPGVYLDVLPGRKLVFTDAFERAWVPSGKAFMVAEISFDDADDGATLYQARVRHWSQADRQSHEEMGFHEGWGKAAEQSQALAQTL